MKEAQIGPKSCSIGCKVITKRSESGPKSGKNGPIRPSVLIVSRCWQGDGEEVAPDQFQSSTHQGVAVHCGHLACFGHECMSHKGSVMEGRRLVFRGTKD